MLADIEAGKVGTVIVKDMSRLGRNYLQVGMYTCLLYTSLRQLKVLAPGKKLPAISKLNTEIEALISEKNAAYNTYRTAKAEYEQLRCV